MLNLKKINEKLTGVSAGLTVAIAFINVALLVVNIVKTVTEEDIEE